MKKLENLIDTIVAWNMGVQPSLKDEPQAYKAAILRQGAACGIKSVLKDISPFLNELVDELEQIGYISHKRSPEEINDLLEKIKNKMKSYEGKN